MTSTAMPAAPSRSMPSPPTSLPGSTRLCAEALAGIADPLFPALTTARVVPPAGAARAILGALLEPLDSPAAGEPLPGWLLPHQADAVTRVRAILRRFGGALVADGVGLGKTFVALALAELERRSGGDAVAFVPAALLPEWARAAQGAGVPLTVHSHAVLARRVPRCLRIAAWCSSTRHTPFATRAPGATTPCRVW